MSELIIRDISVRIGKKWAIFGLCRISIVMVIWNDFALVGCKIFYSFNGLFLLSFPFSDCLLLLGMNGGK